MAGFFITTSAAWDSCCSALNALTIDFELRTYSRECNAGFVRGFDEDACSESSAERGGYVVGIFFLLAASVAKFVRFASANRESTSIPSLDSKSKGGGTPLGSNAGKDFGDGIEFNSDSRWIFSSTVCSCSMDKCF